MSKIKYNDLSWPLKIPVIFMWVNILIMAFAWGLMLILLIISIFI